MTDREVHVRAAAFCAASWVRARRATWTDPEADPAAVAFGTTTPVDFGMGGRFAVLGGPTEEEGETKAPPYLVTLAKTVASTVTETLTKTLEKARSLQVAGAIKLGRRASTALIVAASVMSLAMIGREYWQLVSRTPVAAKVREATAIAPPKTAAPAVDTSVGQLRITSTPASARVTIDGKPRGVTPLLVESLKPGTHSVVLQSTEGTVEESIKITGGDTQELAEAIYPGWLALYSPFDIVISERGRPLALDERHQLLLSPGEHILRIGNWALGYDETKHVTIRPGAVAAVSIAPPKSTLTVTTNSASQVWMDGKLLGDTPLEAVPVDLGTHALVVKYASGEQRQRSVTVTAKPLTIEM
jgi:PEGA domain-containing protein